VDTGDISYLYDVFDTWTDPDDVPWLPSGVFGLSIVQALGQWILDYSHDGKHPGFLFDRFYLDFYQRCRTVNKSVRIFLDQMRFDHEVDKLLELLAKAISPILDNISAHKAIRELEATAYLLDDFRAMFRLEGQIPDEANPNCINSVSKFEMNMKRQVNNFTQKLKVKYD